MSLALVRLLQLASPALPVGAYSYSQGLEWAVETGTVRDEESARTWITDQLEWNLGRFEAPLLARIIEAHTGGAGEAAAEFDALYLASRETAELRAETLQMGHSLRRLIGEMNVAVCIPRATSFPGAWGALAAHWRVPIAGALTAWLWS